MLWVRGRSKKAEADAKKLRPTPREGGRGESTEATACEGSSGFTRGLETELSDSKEEPLAERRLDGMFSRRHAGKREGGSPVLIRSLEAAGSLGAREKEAGVLRRGEGREDRESVQNPAGECRERSWSEPKAGLRMLWPSPERREQLGAAGRKSAFGSLPRRTREMAGSLEELGSSGEGQAPRDVVEARTEPTMGLMEQESSLECSLNAELRGRAREGVREKNGGLVLDVRERGERKGGGGVGAAVTLWKWRRKIVLRELAASVLTP